MRSRHFLSGLTALASILLLLADQGLAQTPKRGRHPARVLRQRDRQPRLPHRARLRNDVGGDERRLRPRQHHARRQVRRAMPPSRGRSSPDGLPTPSSSGRTSSSTTAPRRRRRRQVQHRPADGPGHQVGHAELLRGRAQRRGARSPHVQIRLKQPYAFMLHMLAAYRTGLVLYSPTATQKYTLEDRKQGKPGAVVGLRAVQAGRVGEGQPAGHGPLRQVLPARACRYLDRVSSA